MEYFLSIFFGTFVLEDVALASTLALVTDGKMDAIPAFIACFAGITLGDLGLYFIGVILRQVGAENYFKSVKKFRATLVNEKRSDILTYSVVISRFIPGTRLPTYITAGLLRYPFWRFFILTMVTVLGWVALAFALGESLRSLLMNHWILTVVVVMLFLNILKALIPKLSDPWQRRALLHSWRIWLSFEFWPPTIFYIPLIPYYAFLSLKHGSPLAPFYANPEIKNGGLIGESKWDFLKYLNTNAPSTLKAMKIPIQIDFSKARELIDKEGFSYPFILKPDVGQRGFGVRIIRDDFDLMEYLLLADFEMIIQNLSRLPHEAGVFYIRNPNDTEGQIYSITDKRFPTVSGDGKSKLGDLILNDKRARIIASTYFSRHRDDLDKVPPAGQIVPLTECGNHCQGTIFINGTSLNSTDLQKAIDRISRQLPNFYFGRLDIRYKDADSLKKGHSFEIIEINGAGAEATHIWDAKTTLREAYRDLFEQWRRLFEVGSAVKRAKLNKTEIHPWQLFRECVRVFFRHSPLSRSS